MVLYASMEPLGTYKVAVLYTISLKGNDQSTTCGGVPPKQCMAVISLQS